MFFFRLNDNKTPCTFMTQGALVVSVGHELVFVAPDLAGLRALLTLSDHERNVLTLSKFTVTFALDLAMMIPVVRSSDMGGDSFPTKVGLVSWERCCLGDKKPQRTDSVALGIDFLFCKQPLPLQL
jgi:hypothetical protein